MSSEKPFRLNELVVDPVKDKLIYSGEEVSVPHKLMQLLQFLAKRTNQVVTKEELTNNVWEGFVSDGTLYTQIANLRKLLNDDPNNPRFLKTVPRKGYMLVADVQPLESSTKCPSLLHPVKSKKTKHFLTKAMAGALVFVCCSLLIIGYWFYEFADVDLAKTDEIDFVPLLHHPKRTILINTYIDPLLPDRQRRLLGYSIHVLKYRLSQLDTFHVELAHFKAPDFLLNNLVAHFDDVAPVAWKMEFDIAPESGHLLTLKIQNRQALTVSETSLLLNNAALPDRINKLDSFLNSAIPSELQTEPFNNAGESSLAQILEEIDFLSGAQPFEYLEHVRNYPTLTFENHERQISDLVRVVSENADNCFLLMMLLDKYADFVIRWQSVNKIDRLTEQLVPIIKKQIPESTVNPFVQRAELAAACVSEPSNCRQSFIQRALRHETVYPIVDLMPMAYSITNNTPFPLAHYAFLVRPQQGLNRHFLYFLDSALENLALGELEPHTEIAGFWLGSDHHNTRLLGKTTIPRIQVFREWYNRELHGYLGDNEANVRDIHSSVGYIAQNLLNANQPEMAIQWADFTSDRIAQLESHVLGSIWLNDWDQYRWYTFSNMAKQQMDSMLGYDKWRIAYMDLYSGLPTNALAYYRHLNPELFDDFPDININNIRSAIYLVEAFKQLDMLSQANVLISAIEAYFSKKTTLTRSSAFMGLADAQFYALNREPQKAMKILEQAIMVDNWLPNSFWLWPPIDKDPFLRSLHKNDKFKRLAEYQTQLLTDLCFGNNCSS